MVDIQQFSGYLLVALLLMAVVVPGLVRRAAPADYFLGGRRGGALSVACSFVATCLGASATVGLIGMAYSRGWIAGLWLAAGGAGLFLLGAFWVRPMRSDPAVRTLPQWAGGAYGAPARTLSSILIAVMWCAVIAAQWVAASHMLQGLLGWPLPAGIAASAACVAGYTAWGGQASVLRTDKWQVALILGALILAAVAATGGVAAVPPQASAVSAGSGGMGLVEAFALVLVVGGMYIVGPDLFSRVQVAASRSVARRSAFAAGMVLILCGALVAYIGVRCRYLNPGLTVGSDALGWLVTDSGRTPRHVGMLIQGGLLAAMLSSADTCLMTAATVVQLDLVAPRSDACEQGRYGAFYILAIGVLSALIAWLRPSIIGNMMLAYAFYAGGLLAPLLLLVRPHVAATVRREFVWLAIGAGGGLPLVLIAVKLESRLTVAGLYGTVFSAACLALGWLIGRRRQSVASP